MNVGSGIALPHGTAVYCCPHGLVLKLSWQSCVGLHIVRMEVPVENCAAAKRPILLAAARQFSRLVELERARE